MKEAKSNTGLNQYLREKKLYCYYELKVAKDINFYLSQIEEHQDEALPALEKNGLVWKLSDEDSRRKPCDGFCTPPLPSFLIVKFDQTYYFIRYEEIQKLKSIDQKSINQDEAFGLSRHVFTIKT